MRMPPRQRMINMMYLVLTAMLAMNVSKEVLDAFAVLDADLVRSEQAHQQRAVLEYGAFADAAQKFPDRYGALNDQARSLRSAADSLVRHIEGIKLKALAEAEGLGLQELQGRDATGRDSLLALRHIEAKDDREVITRLLVGSEPADPIDGPGGAKDLKERIVRFRDHLKELCAERSPELASAIDLLFAMEGGTDGSGTWNNWESLNFYEVPLVAGIAHLSKLQADIRSAENDVVKWLYRSATTETRVMSNVASAVVPRSNVVMLGDTFAADVFLAAYDEKNRARIDLDGGADLPLGADGKGKLRLKADRVGEHMAQGVIHYQGPKGMEEYPYAVTYQVMAPLLVASPMKMNVLYRGVDNPIELSVPGVAADRIQPAIDNGSLSRSGNGWVVNKLTGSKAQVSAVVRNDDGSTRRIGPVQFRVKDLPPPMAIVGGKGSRDATIRKTELTSAQGVVARLEDADFDAPWKVQQFQLTLIKGSEVIQLAAQDGRFTEPMKDLLKAVRPGQRVYVEGVKARLANGQGPVRDLTPVVLKVVP